MALNGKYTKIGPIIDGVYRDFGWTHEFNWIDAVEWIGECLDLIGTAQQYVQRITDGNEDLNHPCPVIINNYRGAVPCDLLYIIQVKEKTTGAILRHSSDSFHTGLEKSEANLPAAVSEFNFPLEANTVNLLKDSCQNDLTYTINDCYIFTNFDEGELIISYKAFPTDQDGLPMIPDSQAFKQAIKFYIAEKVMAKLYIQGKVDGGRLQYISGERDWYVGKANSDANLPTMDQMETWKNEFVRLIPNINQHASGFKYAGDQQKVNKLNSL